MPIYEYRCEACGHELEAIQKMADAFLTDCPACSKSALKRKISAVGFRLKGGGWYETDFKTGDKKRNIVKPDAPLPESSKAEGTKVEKGAKVENSKDGKSADAAAVS